MLADIEQDIGFCYEYELLRQLYGLLLTLANRSFSVGNMIAFHAAVDDIQEVIEQLQRTERHIIGEDQLSVIRSIIYLKEVVPIKFIAESLTRTLFNRLSKYRLGPDYSIHYHEKLNPTITIRHLVVVIGPTIGVGDELIIAQSLADKIHNGHVQLYVSTKRFGLWSPLNVGAENLGASPIAHLDFIASRPAAADGTGLLYADFLRSDPSEFPVYMPENIAFSARWIFGDSSCKIVDIRKKKAYYYKYPEYCVQSRTVECAWIASQFMRNDTLPAKASEGAFLKRPDKADARKTIILQLLTSKPELILEKEIYIDALKRFFDHSGRDANVKLIAGPNAEAKKLTDCLYDELIRHLPDHQVQKLPVMDLHSLTAEINNAAVLVGPDTFTGHIAAFNGIPQVTIHLPKHKAWRNICSPSFYIAGEAPFHGVSDAILRRLLIILQEDEAAADQQTADDARTWYTSAMLVMKYILGFYDTRGICSRQMLRESVCRLKGLVEKYERRVGMMVGGGQWVQDEGQHVLQFRESSFSNATDELTGVSTWFQRVASSDVSAFLFTRNKRLYVRN